MNRRHLLLTLGASLFAIGPAAAQNAVPAAGAFIESLTSRAIRSLTAPDAVGAERTRRFRALLNEGFDVPTIGRFALGRFWRLASAAEQAEYMRLFEDLLVQTYATRFNEYSGEQVRVRGSRATPEGDIFVSSEVVHPTTRAVTPVDWVLRREGSTFKVIEISVEGVRMAVTYRDEFAAVISRGGGQIAALLRSLRERTQGS